MCLIRITMKTSTVCLLVLVAAVAVAAAAAKDDLPKDAKLRIGACARRCLCCAFATPNACVASRGGCGCLSF